MKYLWDFPDNYKNHEVAVYDKNAQLKELQIFDLMGGAELPEDWISPPFTVKTKVSNILRYDCIVNNGTAPLVSKRFMDILEQYFQEYVQFFPTKITALDDIIEDYCVVNVTKIGQFIDLAKSDYSMYREYDKPRSFTKIVVLDAPSSFPIAREASFSSFIFVSEEFKKICEKYSISNIELLNANSFTR